MEPGTSRNDIRKPAKQQRLAGMKLELKRCNTAVALRKEKNPKWPGYR